jgi:uncharacterized protein (TIGR02145 family)
MKSLLIAVFLIAGALLNAQDVIIHKNGEKISAKVLEITPELVKYKKFTNLEGPIYSVYKSDVVQITYQDGTVESFSAKPVITNDEKKRVEEKVVTKKEDERKADILTDLRDNQKYKIVQVGEQVWMAQNFNYASNQSWCYDNLPANCERYGRLYTYEAAKNVCPTGWHLPSDDEWKKLEIELGMQTVVNKNGWRGTSPGQGKLMKIGGGSGLNVELTGFREYEKYYKLDKNGYFWTSSLSEGKNQEAVFRELNKRASVKRDVADIRFGYSVRCIEGNTGFENKAIPEEEKIDRLTRTHDRTYFSIGIGSGVATGYFGLKAQAKIGFGQFGFGVQYGMGVGPNAPEFSLGAKIYYKYYFINALVGHRWVETDRYSGDAFDRVAVLAGMEYPLSKHFNISGGVGYAMNYDIPIAWELGFNYKIFK